MISENWKRIQNQIIRTIEDPLVETLLQKSQLTKVQLETLLIDILVEKIIGNHINYEEKARLRHKTKKITRGAYSRTLKQARRNIKKSIYTIFLLGYLGILDSPDLHPFLELSNKINLYVKTYLKLWDKQKEGLISSDILREMRNLKSSLINGINKL